MAFRDINKKKGPKILGNGILVVDDPSSLNFIGAVTVTSIGRDVTVNIIGAATSITGLITAGTNVTITGTGTIADPYVINSSGGGSGMIYPAAGIPVSTGSAWGTSIPTDYYVPYTGALHNVDLGTHSIQSPLFCSPNSMDLTPGNGYINLNGNRITMGSGSSSTTILNNIGKLNFGSTLETTIEVTSGFLKLQADNGDVSLNTIHAGTDVNVNSANNININGNGYVNVTYDIGASGTEFHLVGGNGSTRSMTANDTYVPATYGVTGSKVQLADGVFTVNGYGVLNFDTPNASNLAYTSNAFSIDPNANSSFAGPSFNVNSNYIYLNASAHGAGDISLLNYTKGNYIKIYGAGGSTDGAIDIMSKDNDVHLYSSNNGNGLTVYDNGGVDIFASGGHNLQIWNDYNGNGLYLYASGMTQLTAENGATLHLYNDNNGNGFEATGSGGIDIYANNGQGAVLRQDDNGNKFTASNDGSLSLDAFAGGSINLKTNSGGGAYVNVDYMTGGGNQMVTTDNDGNLIAAPIPSGGGSPQIPTLRVDYNKGTETQCTHSDSSSTVPLGTDSPVFNVCWDGFDTSFTAYNPSIWLYTYKITNKNNRGRGIKRKDWFHPVTQNGATHAGKRWAAGSTSLPDRTTEFNCPSTPTTKVQITIDPKEWRGPFGVFMTDVFPYAVSDWEQDPNCMVKASGGKYQVPGGVGAIYPAKTTSFRFRIVIDNPDTTSDIPFLYGPMSDAVHISPKKGNLTDGAFYYSWKARLERTLGSR